MITSDSDSKKAYELVRAFAGIASTEELFLFVAGNEGMLSFCQELIKQLDSSDSPAPDVRLVNTACSSRGILSGLLYEEVRKVLLALNRIHDPARDHYKILGLEPTADTGEVKKAYRKLSMQFHPDKAHQANGTADRFLEISGAYHAIMLNSRTLRPELPPTWRKVHQSRQNKQAQNKKKLFLGFFSLVAVLVLLSFFIAKRYHDKALTAQLYPRKTLPVSRQETAPEVSRQNVASPVAKPATAPTMAAPPVAVNRAVMPKPAKAGAKKQQALPLPARKIPLTAKKNSAVKKITIAEPGPVAAAATTAKKNSLALIANHKPTVQMTAEKAGKTDNIRARLAVSRKHAKKIKILNTALRINALLNQYTDLYNRKNLIRFLALFTNEATENGQPVTSLVGDYEKLFAKTKQIKLQLDNLTWHDNLDKDQHNFLVQGNFVGIYTYKNGTSPKYTGKIAFRLREDRGTLKISSLVYSFRQQ